MNAKIEAAILSIYADSVKNPPKTLDGHIKNEIAVTNDYRGRAIYEFFQNSIDKAKSKIWIHLDKSQRTLTIANDGLEFSIEKGDQNYSDLESLCSINTSSKNQNESIGNKGVGFKSCWEYTKKVSVCSIFEGTHWGFELHNPLNVDKIITPIGNQLINIWKSNKDYSNVLKNNNNNIPSFYFPLPIENAEKYFESFNDAVTVIVFHDLTDEKLEELSKKIIEFSEHQIFFVQQLDKLKNSNVQLELMIDQEFKKILNTQANSEEWLIQSKEFEGEELNELRQLSYELNYKIENPKIAIAFPLNQSLDDHPNFHSNFYCYLPTEVTCGFNVLIHGDFLLDVSRKQIDFVNNKYNKKLLNHIAKLFVDSLLEKTELHNLPYFGKFLSPRNKSGKIEGVFKEFLFASSKITAILSKVYTADRNWNIDSYTLIFDVIDRWKRDRYSRENTDYYYDIIYKETIQYFCDPHIFIVPIIEGETIIYLDNLPGKESEKRLFFRKKEETTIDNNVLEKLKNLTITDFNSINQEYYFRSVVKKYSSTEIIRAINIDKGINENDDFYPSILKFVFNLIQDSPPKTDRQSFYADNSLEYQLARIKLPCINKTWHPAIQCYTGIYTDISVHFNIEEFFELDLIGCEQIIGKESFGVNEIRVFLKRFGIWESTLPFQYRNKIIKLPFTKFPQLKNNQLKLLINKSIPDWQNLAAKDGLLKVIKNESWFYDEANKTFVSPDKVFLFNDSRARKCIAQEHKSDELQELYNFLGIKSIEDTKDLNKITDQLERMKSLEVDEYHITVYKQLILRNSRLEYFNIKEIPLLTTESKYESEPCWFVPQDHRKYVHHFPGYNFLNFDVNTAIGFIKNLTHVNSFEPEFFIMPDLDKLKKDLEIKEYFEKEYLTDFFALAEKVMPSLDFDKENCIRRWNNLDIYKAHDVWLKVIFNHETNELYKNEKKDVLYKPLSRTIRESVGFIAYDLDDYVKNVNLSKFGIAFAEAIFRNQNIGEILSNYIQKKQVDVQNASEYLKEKGIGDSDINQAKWFIDRELVIGKQKEDFLHAIEKVVGVEINPDNWTQKELYKGHSFLNLKENVIHDLKLINDYVGRFESLLELINPYQTNLKFFIDQKKYLQICHYAHYNQELTNDKFDKMLSDKSDFEEFFSFDFNLNHCQSILGISSDIDDSAFENAETNLKIIDIQREYGLSGKMELAPIVSNGIKIQNISPIGEAETHTTKRTLQYYEELSRAQHKRGLGMERILSLQYAQQLILTNQSENVKDCIKGLDELSDLEIPDQINGIENMADILQVSTKKGDGLGYDILQPVFEEGRLKYFNRVEIKSSKSDPILYLSEPERLKILHFAKLEEEKGSTNWKLYHYVDGKAFDRTKCILEAVKTHAKTYNGNQLLAADTWVINFEN